MKRKGREGLLRRLGRSPSGAAGLAILGFWLVVVAVSQVWTPHPPTQFHMTHRLEAPSPQFPFGTDKFGRDVLARVMAGSGGVIGMALAGTLLAVLLGAAVGLASGYFGGAPDELAMRLMDILMSFPALLLALLVLGMMGPGLLNVVLVIGVVFAPRVARGARDADIETMPEEIVEAARARGERAFHIMVVEILPNTLGPLGVEFSVRFAYAIFLSASLGFLGLGVQPPSPDWGLMVSEGRDFITMAPWIVFFPALAIASLVVGVNLLADAVRALAAGEV